MSIQSCGAADTLGLRNLGSEVRIFLAAQPRTSKHDSVQIAAEVVAKIDRSAGPGECWPWTGRTDRDGYGVFGKDLSAHRTVCEAVHGAPGFPKAEAAHSCDNPPCCNPDHLSWKTHAQNVAEQFERGNHGNFTRVGTTYKCGSCGGAGHNARRHYRNALATAGRALRLGLPDSGITAEQSQSAARALGSAGKALRLIFGGAS